MRKLFYFLAAVMLLLQAGKLAAQEYYDNDSLLAALRLAGEDSAKVSLLIAIGQQYEGSRPDSAIIFYEQALDLSRQLNYTRGIISYYTNVTYVYNMLGKYDTALQLNLRSLEIARAWGDQERIATCTYNVAASYSLTERYERAIDHYLQSLSLFESLRDSSRLNIIFASLSSLYDNIGDYPKAEEYSAKGLQLARKSGNPFHLATALNTRALALIHLYQYPPAVVLLEEGIAICRKYNQKYTLNSLLLSLGDVYLKTGNPGKAKRLYEEGLQLSLDMNDAWGRCISLRGLAYTGFAEGRWALAHDLALQSVAIAREHQFRQDAGKGLLLLSDIALAQGDRDAYWELRHKSDSVGNVALNETLNKNIQQLEEQYKSQQREQKIQQLEQEKAIQALESRKNRLLLLIFVAIACALIVIALLLLRSNRQQRRILEQEKEIQQQRITELEIEKQLISSDAVLRGQEEERSRLARDLHDGLGGTLSGIKFSFNHMKENLILTPGNQQAFERSMDMLDSSIRELRHIAHNMMPESLLKFGLDTALRDYCRDLTNSGALRVTYQSFNLADMAALQTTYITIYRIVQELLNNARKHAAATNTLVQLIYDGNKLTITVEDDGRGFPTGHPGSGEGMGWRNIKSRIEYLKGQWDIQSEAGKGATVNIEISL